MEEMITVREWIKRFENDQYKKSDFDTQASAGWYDWFCRDDELARRLKKMGAIISQITNEFILDNFRVWFKNNCPMVGPLYDDMRFEPMDETKRDQQYFLVSINDRRADHKYEVITARSDYKSEFGGEEADEVIAFINKLGVKFATKAA